MTRVGVGPRLGVDRPRAAVVDAARGLRRAHQAAPESARGRDERRRVLSGGARRSPICWRWRSRRSGTALVAGGAAVLNQVYESDTDALMDRTRSRPLPAGRVAPADARTFGLALAAHRPRPARIRNQRARGASRAGDARHLSRWSTRRSSVARRVATLVGAIPGALPALIGWTAGHGAASVGGWTLFAIVFLWQIPHFMAIAWMYRDDYRKARFPMLPVLEPDGRRTGRQAVVYAALLVPASLAPTLVGVAGWAYSGDRAGSRRGPAGPGGPVRVDADRRRRARAVLRVHHLPAAHLGGDDARSLNASPSASRAQSTVDSSQLTIVRDPGRLTPVRHCRLSTVDCRL